MTNGGVINLIRVRYYAAARELVRQDAEEISLDETVTLAVIRDRIAMVHPPLAPYIERMRFAVNGEFASLEDLVRPGDELDVIPPVAGGSQGPIAGIQSEPLSIDAAMREVLHSAAGAVAIFTGVVRDHSDGHRVSRLDYEAHPELALKELRRVLAKIAEEAPEVRLSVHHRVGQLQVGDLAIVIAASAPHRADAFDACRAAIDRIKETVPIWKKEWDEHGEANWVGLEDQ
jgi:molybdopterin synthase catalytic subunit